MPNALRLAVITTILLVGANVASATRVSTEELQNKLRLAPNVVSRINILDQDGDFVFDCVYISSSDFLPETDVTLGSPRPSCRYRDGIR